MPAARGAPGRPFEIMTVCTANVCRSPLAERLLRLRLVGPEIRLNRPPAFSVHSAGVRAWEGAPMDPPTAAELLRLGGDPTGFVARDLTVALCEAADLILTATAEHRAVVLQESPRALKRTFTLLEFAHLVSDVASVRRLHGDPFALVRAASVARGASTLDDYDITDPFEQPPEVLGVVVDVISGAVDQVALALSGRRVA